jgi:hypothetical protein
MTRVRVWSAAMAITVVGVLVVQAADEWAEGFAWPSAETRPWFYWYWISDNLSKEGITQDLESMLRLR